MSGQADLPCTWSCRSFPLRSDKDRLIHQYKTKIKQEVMYTVCFDDLGVPMFDEEVIDESDDLLRIDFSHGPLVLPARPL
jgi:hypothetical protein